MTAENPAGCVTDLQFLDQGGIMQSALVEIEHRFGVVIELLLIESHSPFEHVDGAGLRSGLRFKQARLWRNDSRRETAKSESDSPPQPWQ